MSTVAQDAFMDPGKVGIIQSAHQHSGRGCLPRFVASQRPDSCMPGLQFPGNQAGRTLAPVPRHTQIKSYFSCTRYVGTRAFWGMSRPSDQLWNFNALAGGVVGPAVVMTGYALAVALYLPDFSSRECGLEVAA